MDRSSHNQADISLHCLPSTWMMHSEGYPLNVRYWTIQSIFLRTSFAHLFLILTAVGHLTLETLLEPWRSSRRQLNPSSSASQPPAASRHSSVSSLGEHWALFFTSFASCMIARGSSPISMLAMIGWNVFCCWKHQIWTSIRINHRGQSKLPWAIDRFAVCCAGGYRVIIVHRAFQSTALRSLTVEE